MKRSSWIINRIAFLTLVYKEVQRFTRLWVQTVLPSLITTCLYFLIFGKVIGSRIGEFSGVTYIEFIAPGLVMMAVITNSYANVVSSFYSARFSNAVEELLISSMPDWVILWGYLVGGMVRGLSVGILVLLIALFFTDLSVYNIYVTFIILLLTSFLFSLGGFVNAVFARSFDDISIIPNFVLTPLTYLGGVFYSITMLPEFWQWVSKLNPILYMVNGFRYGILGLSDVSVRITIIVLVLCSIALYFWALHLMQKPGHLRQ